ncbi:sporulation protein YpjB [Metabacillus sediminilitoris]|uniref:Sporulation protein YpjB n=1 Tax=Metabacillus sediminilitoris TaxID=2567941 RepID=A0A4V3WG93_9BACI|nr:sporulation protein YpjB [Metabacillus sediminilitoris]QGQ46673.1 sporulation protein YpjB [Metabacillus sediminilitoris]THF82823.1 sporulation protein YpjB [Metabacillus sediminilitoris]
MKKWIAAIMISMLLIYMKPALGEEAYDWESLNEISDTALQLAKQERFNESAQLLDYFAVKFKELPLENENISVDHLRTITSTHKNAKDILRDEKVSTNEKVRSLTKFRLVVDAMVSEHQPLWGSMESSIMETFTQMKNDVVEGDNQSFQHDWNQFLSLYEVIYPSIQVDLDSQRVKQMDAHISLVEDRLFQEISETSRFKQLAIMEEELKALFERVKEDEADPSLLWVMISTGSVILLSLSYAGFRKYRAEKARIEKREINKE